MGASSEALRRGTSRIGLPVALGIVSFLAVAGPRPLDWRNIRWLSQGDPAAYFLGWHFFRNTPWSFPLGANPRYGAELAGGIAHADNVPLLAMLGKALSPLLPDVCQYFGFWLCASFALQAWFAWLLVGLLTRETLARACGTLLFVLAPPFLWRLQGHYSMQGQWLVLAALYLCLGPRPLARGAAWPLLAFTASLVHSYITAMVLGLWLTDWIRRVWLEGRRRADFVQLALVPSLVLLGFWQSGLFLIREGIAKSGFGKYHLNLLSLVDASGWSYVLPDIPEGRGAYEGFNYLGLGSLLLAVIAIPAVRRAWPALRQRRQYWPLLALLVAFTLFAISTTIGLAGFRLRLPVPASWVERANLLRASGRMFWPVYYALLWVILRQVVGRHSPRVAGSLLAGAALLQALDTSSGWLPIRRDLAIRGTSWHSPLKAPFWAEVPARYREIRLIQPKNQAPNYAPFAYFAAMHGMSTDAVYLARIDLAKLAQAELDALRVVNEGRYREGTLYVLDASYEQAARASLHSELDLLTHVDGFLILAPGWNRR